MPKQNGDQKQMSNNLRTLKRAQTKQPEAANGNIEELAANARAERQEKCGLAVNKVLEEHNCTLAIYLRFGETNVPVQQVVVVPAVVLAVSK